MVTRLDTSAMLNSIVPFILIILALCVIILAFLFLLKFSQKPGSLFKGFSKKPKSIYIPLKTIESQKGKLEDFEENLYTKDSSVGLILGARGSGKSALGMRIAENFAMQTSKNICAMGFEKKDVPKYISVIEAPEQIPNNSFVLIDEGGVFFSSRESTKEANKLVSKIILLSRHKDLSILFISQNSSNIEINTIRQADYLMLKPSSLLQLDFERKKIKDIYTQVQTGFEKYKQEKGLFYIYSDRFSGFVSNSLPSFWSKKISKTLEDKKIGKN